jgi:hypothetical protein
MLIQQESWNDIIKTTEAKIANWNARAKERGVEDTFFVDVREASGYCLLITKHVSSGPDDIKVVAREIATSQMRPAKLNKDKKGRIVGFTVKPEPKAWKSLAEKPAETIVAKVGLTNFLLILGSRISDSVTVAL